MANKILISSPLPDKTVEKIPDVEGELNIVYREFDYLLAESDFLVITASLNNETRHMFTMAQFKKMKPSSILVNTGRGPIVKEDDLVKELNEGIIWGAGLDV